MNSHTAKCQALRKHCNALRFAIQTDLDNISFELCAMGLISTDVRDQSKATKMISTIENRLAVDESVWDKIIKVLDSCNLQALVRKLSDQLREEMHNVDKSTATTSTAPVPMATKDVLPEVTLGHGVQPKAGIAANGILRKRIVTVTEVIKLQLNHFNNRLKEEGLIAEGVFDPDDKVMEKSEYASVLYSACMTAVTVDSSKFSVVLDILSGYPLLEKAVQEMAKEGIEAGLLEVRLGTIPPIKGATRPNQNDGATLGPQAAGTSDRSGSGETDADQPPTPPLPEALDTSHLHIIRRSLHGLTDWQGLGLEIGLDFSALDSIDEKKRGDVDKCKTAMLHSWLQAGNATKSFLTAALGVLGEDAIAANIQ